MFVFFLFNEIVTFYKNKNKINLFFCLKGHVVPRSLKFNLL